MDNKNIVIGVVVAIAAVLAVIAFKNPTVIEVPTSLKLDASTLGAQKAPVVNVAPAEVTVRPNINVQAPAPVLGGLSSPVLTYPYVVFNGFRKEYAYMDTLATATTTPCHLQSPSATSTLMSAWVDINTSTTSESHLQLGTSATMNATTTLIAQITIPANVGVQVIATSTQSSNPVLAPNSWVNLKASPTIAAGVAGAQGTVSFTGSCGAEFNVVSY